MSLYLLDNTTGQVHAYGTDPHDSLVLQNDGSLHYYNLQNGCGTKFPKEGYAFCYADGTLPDFAHPEEDGIIEIAGQSVAPPAKTTTDLTERIAVRDALAKELDGIEYGDSLLRFHIYAKKNNLLIVTGASDDLFELDGAIQDEAGCWNGKRIYLNQDGVVENEDKEKATAYIDAIWCGKIGSKPMGDPWEFTDDNGELICWCYQTAIPHTDFMMYEDGEPYCRGLVICMEDLQTMSK